MRAPDLAPNPLHAMAVCTDCKSCLRYNAPLSRTLCESISIIQYRTPRIMPANTQNYFHVLIRGIPPRNDKDDVEKHILEVLGAKSVVYDVVPDPESATYCTTVCFLVPPNDKGDYILSRLNYTKFRSLPQEIHLDRDFYGLTPLADEPGSSIEYVRVHSKSYV
jgi:hypothetical protein